MSDITMDIEELVENFELFDEWVDRYRYLIDLGRKIPELEDSAKTEENKVQGCQSQVWLVVDREENDTLVFRADSDSAIVKGLIFLILTLYSHKKPDEIVAADIESVFKQIGLDQHLSPNRRNGFFSMVQRIKSLAVQHAAT